MPQFKNLADVEEWLVRQTPNVAAAFALQSALRVTPVLAVATSYWTRHPAKGREVVATAFQCLRGAWSRISAKNADPPDVLISDSLEAYASILAVYENQSELDLAIQTQDITASAQAAKACHLAAMAACSPNADRTTSAIDAVRAALSAVAKASFPFHSGPPAAERILQAFTLDATIIQRGGDLLAQSLWTTFPPAWAGASWETLKSYIRSERPELETWIDWYEQRLHPTFAGRAGFHAGNSSADAPLAPGVAEDEAAPFNSELVMRPAMIEPVWRGDRLTIADQPLFDHGIEILQDALIAFRTHLLGLAESLSGHSNYDRTLIAFLFEVAGWISDQEPNQVLIFELGYATATFDDNLVIVEKEWPEFQSARYQALRRELGVLLQKCPAWRVFKAELQTLTREQVSLAPRLSEVMATTLEGESDGVVDPIIPATLRRQARTSVIAGASRSEDFRANDQLESTSNVLKSLIGGIVGATRPASSLWKHIPERSLKAFGEGVADGAANQARWIGGGAVRRILDALARNAVRAGLMSGEGRAAEFLSSLVHQIPSIFGWLEEIVFWFQSL